MSELESLSASVEKLSEKVDDCCRKLDALLAALVEEDDAAPLPDLEGFPGSGERDQSQEL